MAYLQQRVKKSFVITKNTIQCAKGYGGFYYWSTGKCSDYVSRVDSLSDKRKYGKIDGLFGYQCVGCSAWFQKQKALELHKGKCGKKNNTKRYRYRGSNKNKSITVNDCFYDGIYDLLDVNYGSIVCKYKDCSKRFDNFKDLKYHIGFTHGTRSCNKEFLYKTKMLDSNNNNMDYRFICGFAKSRKRTGKKQTLYHVINKARRVEPMKCELVNEKK